MKAPSKLIPFIFFAWFAIPLSYVRSEANSAEKYWAVLCQDGYTRGYVKDYKKGERLGAKLCDRAIYQLVDANDPTPRKIRVNITVGDGIE